MPTVYSNFNSNGYPCYVNRFHALQSFVSPTERYVAGCHQLNSGRIKRGRKKNKRRVPNRVLSQRHPLTGTAIASSADDVPRTKHPVTIRK